MAIAPKTLTLRFCLNIHTQETNRVLVFPFDLLLYRRAPVSVEVVASLLLASQHFRRSMQA